MTIKEHIDHMREAVAMLNESTCELKQMLEDDSEENENKLPDFEIEVGSINHMAFAIEQQIAKLSELTKESQ